MAKDNYCIYHYFFNVLKIDFHSKLSPCLGINYVYIACTMHPSHMIQLSVDGCSATSARFNHKMKLCMTSMTTFPWYINLYKGQLLFKSIFVLLTFSVQDIVTVEPRLTVTSLNQSPLHCGHPGSVPNDFP